MTTPAPESPSPREPTLIPPIPLPLLPPPPQPTAPPANPRRLPPPCWSFEETIALIDAYRDKWYSLRRGNLKANHWQEVADVVVSKCPAVSPPKTAVQCRHKMEKLRKRYRTEIQRGRALPVARWSSSWVHFKRMESMEKGPQEVKPDYDIVRSVNDKNNNSDPEVNDSDNDDFDDDGDDNNNNNGVFVASNGVNIHNRNGNNMGYYPGNYKNANEVLNARSLQKLYRNGMENASVTSRAMALGGMPIPGGVGVGVGGGGGFRIRIPTGVSIAQPAPPKFYAKADPKYVGGGGGGGVGGGNANFVPNLSSMRPNFVAGGMGVGGDSSRSFRVDEEMGKKREREPMEEMVAAIKVLGDGFVRIEQMKMEMAREIEAMRMEMEMKRTEMILDSQQRIVEAFARAFAEKKKKPKRMPSPGS